MKIIFSIGGALIDETFTCFETPVTGTSNPATFFRSPGGVSQNIAHHLAQLGNKVELITQLGNDHDGKWLAEQCETAGIGLTHSLINNQPTGRYVAMLDNEGNLFAGAAAMHFETAITAEFLKSKAHVLKGASLIQTDCNLSINALEWLIDFCRSKNINCVIEPVSVAKAKKLRSVNLRDVLLLTPNMDELTVISGETGEQKIIDSILYRGVKNLWLRKGSDGSQFISKNEILFHPASEIKIENVTGAGDAALAGWIHYFLQDKNMKECMRAGQAMSDLILQSKGGVMNNLNAEMLTEKIESITYTR